MQAALQLGVLVWSPHSLHQLKTLNPPERRSLTGLMSGERRQCGATATSEPKLGLLSQSAADPTPAHPTPPANSKLLSFSTPQTKRKSSRSWLALDQQSFSPLMLCSRSASVMHVLQASICHGLLLETSLSLAIYSRWQFEHWEGHCFSALMGGHWSAWLVVLPEVSLDS